LSDSELEEELLKMTDSYTNELFAPNFEGTQSVVFPVSRLVVDPERFIDDDQENMAARGMGAIYTRISDGRPLRNPPSKNERKVVIERFYRPHHLKLQESVETCLQRFGRSTGGCPKTGTELCDKQTFCGVDRSERILPKKFECEFYHD